MRRVERATSVARGFEHLEPRCMLSSTTVVGDASFVYYDQGAAATVDTTFSRDTTTVDALGGAVDVDQRRYGEALDYTASLAWEKLESGLLADEPLATIAPLASGWDHDGQTPLAVFEVTGPDRGLLFVHGDSMEIAGRVVLPNNDLGQGQYPDRRYWPEAAIVHHGLVVIATQRLVDRGEGYMVEGVDFFYTQDFGATFTLIPSADSHDGVPPIAGDASIGIQRLREWSFANPFPVNGIDDTESVWFPWADYLFKTGNPKGGQIGLFRADRDPVDGEWDVSPNRLIHSVWNDDDSGGFHAHAAAITEGGLISHWGDVGYRNVTQFHQFDLEDYLNSSITTVDAFGGQDFSQATYPTAPQPVATAPSPVAGEHFASGDNTPDHVLSFSSLSTVADQLEIESEVFQPHRRAPGGVYEGVVILHLHWLQGVGYVSAGREDDFAYFSPDGERWAEINSPDGTPGTIWMYGDRLIRKVVGENNFWVADLPTIETVRPLQLSPGGTNELTPDVSVYRAPGAGNSLREVVFESGQWRYADTLVALDVQAPPPAGLEGAKVYEVVGGSQSIDYGGLWLQGEREVTDTSVNTVVDAWVANLGEQSAVVGLSQRATGIGGGFDAESPFRYFEIADTTQWTPTGVSNQIQFDGQARYGLNLNSQFVRPGARFLVAISYFGEAVAPTYPLQAQASGADEVERVTGLDLSGEWSSGFVARWPENAPQATQTPIPLASYTGHDGDAIEVIVEQFVSNFSRIRVELYENGELVHSEEWFESLYRSDVIEFVLSSGPRGVVVTSLISGRPAQTFELGQYPGLSLDQFTWASRTGDVVAGVEPVLSVFDDDAAWDAEQQTEWLTSSLKEKALFQAKPALGDYNSDGVVDEIDLAVWEANQWVPVVGRPGDSNLDGEVNEADRAIWVSQYGMTETLPGDMNGDGVVDETDQTLWHEAASNPLPPRPGDANRDGVVDLHDRFLWASQFGQSGEGLAGDLNQDGVVDAADYTVWRDNEGATYPDDPADVNRDGVVDGADLAILEANLGQVTPVLAGDMNDDGRVDAADYTVWRDATAPQVVSGTGADGDHSGYVDAPDLTIWQLAFGSQYPSFEELVSQAQGAPTLATAHEAPPSDPEPTPSEVVSQTSQTLPAAWIENFSYVSPGTELTPRRVVESKTVQRRLDLPPLSAQNVIGEDTGSLRAVWWSSETASKPDAAAWRLSDEAFRDYDGPWWPGFAGFRWNG